MEDDTAPNAPAYTTDAERTEWSGRFDAAWSRLNSAAGTAPLYRLVSETSPRDEPRAEVVAGHTTLAQARRIGLLPGSFNPLTLAHIALAETARRSAKLDVVAWAIAARTVDKEDVLRATIPDRLAQLAAYTHVAAEDAVLMFNRGLYVEQADALRALVGRAVQVVIVVGFDKVVQILDPRYYTDRDAALDELFSRAALLVAPRLDEDAAALTQLLARPENAAYASHITYLDLPHRYRQDSSTEVREALRDDNRDTALTRGIVQTVVPPEGYALAQLGPYRPATGDPADRYATRVRWLATLCRIAPAQLAALPSLADLVASTLAVNKQGAALRSWLDHAEHAEHAGALPDVSLVKRYVEGGD